MTDRKTQTSTSQSGSEADATTGKDTGTDKPKEVGGRKGPEPTRYGDWEKNGLISDF